MSESRAARAAERARRLAEQAAEQAAEAGGRMGDRARPTLAELQAEQRPPAGCRCAARLDPYDIQSPAIEQCARCVRIRCGDMPAGFLPPRVDCQIVEISHGALPLLRACVQIATLARDSP